MSIKTKLIVFLLLLIFVPILAVNIFSSKTSENMAVDIIEENISNLTASRAGSINFYFEELIGAVKELASYDELRQYTSESNSTAIESLSENEFYSDVKNKLITASKSNSSVIKTVIFNNAGVVVLSTDEKDVGTILDNYLSLLSMTSENSGISPMFINNDVPVFFVIKPVYSTDNERQGAVCQIYDTSYIQKLLTNVQFDKYTTSAVMDHSGNIFEYPFKTTKNYLESDNFSGASDYLRSIITAEDGDYPDSSYKFNVKRGTRMVFYSEIQSSGWIMLNISDEYNIISEIDSSGSSLRNFSIIMIILSCAASGLFIFFFSRPVSNIMDTLKKKLKGDSGAKFNITTKDEFNEIGQVFDSLFEEVFEYDQRYKAMIETTNNISFEINLETTLVTVSKNFNQKFSYRPKDDSISESFIYKMRVHKDDKERFNADFNRILSQANSMQGEYRVKDIYGDFIWIMIKASKLYNRNNVPVKILGVIMDIDKEKKSEMHLIQKASFDALTQLYNRETFLKSLDTQIRLAANKKTLDALMFVDLDDFKYFNDQFGHACGDEVLKFVADTLKEISFEHGFAGRFGGDEFVMCLTDLTLYGDCGKIAQEIIDTLAEGFISESTGEKLNIHCSIGIAFLIESGKNTEEVIAAADEAMYNIKKHGKSAFAYARSHITTAEAYLDDIM